MGAYNTHMFGAEYHEKWFQNPLATESVSQLKEIYFEASISGTVTCEMLA